MATKLKKAGLKKGDAVVVKNRIYAVVDKSGRIAWGADGFCIFGTRKEARDDQQEHEFVIRLRDIIGDVV